MPRNRTEKSRRIAQPGWIITRVNTLYTGHDVESLMMVTPWTQEFANKCERMWSDFDYLRSASPSAEDIVYLEKLPIYDDGELHEWMEEEAPEFGYLREEAYWDGGFFSLERPPLPDVPNMVGTVDAYVHLYVSAMHISARIQPTHGDFHWSDSYIHRRDTELFKAEP